VTFVALPTGRLLYAEADASPFVIVRHDRSGALFVVEDGWRDGAIALGPFHPRDVLRALRLANVRVPEGCERGPWRWGTGLFPASRLPHPAGEWSAFAPAWASPSASHYRAEDVDRVVNEICCAPSHEPPRVRWSDAPAVDAEIRDLVLARFPDAGLDVAGVLDRAWNAHPRGSLVLAATPLLAPSFAIADLPPNA
jgi:hypothetical protein